ncbi:hypothetical protein BC829DRAFT_439376 [Chytridium lagenaria]|nr:hypothetical protein BC829DRAFT_439376 [Chytridium lagenaria]
MQSRHVVPLPPHMPQTSKVLESRGRVQVPVQSVVKRVGVVGEGHWPRQSRWSKNEQEPQVKIWPGMRHGFIVGDGDGPLEIDAALSQYVNVDSPPESSGRLLLVPFLASSLTADSSTALVGLGGTITAFTTSTEEESRGDGDVKDSLARTFEMMALVRLLGMEEVWRCYAFDNTKVWDVVVGVFGGDVSGRAGVGSITTVEVATTSEYVDVWTVVKDVADDANVDDRIVVVSEDKVICNVFDADTALVIVEIKSALSECMEYAEDIIDVDPNIDTVESDLIDWTKDVTASPVTSAVDNIVEDIVSVSVAADDVRPVEADEDIDKLEVDAPVEVEKDSKKLNADPKFVNNVELVEADKELDVVVAMEVDKDSEKLDSDPKLVEDVNVFSVTVDVTPKEVDGPSKELIVGTGSVFVDGVELIELEPKLVEDVNVFSVTVDVTPKEVDEPSKELIVGTGSVFVDGVELIELEHKLVEDVNVFSVTVDVTPNEVDGPSKELIVGTGSVFVDGVELIELETKLVEDVNVFSVTVDVTPKEVDEPSKELIVGTGSVFVDGVELIELDECPKEVDVMNVADVDNGSKRVEVVICNEATSVIINVETIADVDEDSNKLEISSALATLVVDEYRVSIDVVTEPTGGVVDDILSSLGNTRETADVEVSTVGIVSNVEIAEVAPSDDALSEEVVEGAVEITSMLNAMRVDESEEDVIRSADRLSLATNGLDADTLYANGRSEGTDNVSTIDVDNKLVTKLF